MGSPVETPSSLINAPNQPPSRWLLATKDNDAGTLPLCILSIHRVERASRRNPGENLSDQTGHALCRVAEVIEALYYAPVTTPCADALRGNDADAQRFPVNHNIAGSIGRPPSRPLSMVTGSPSETTAYHITSRSDGP